MTGIRIDLGDGVVLDWGQVVAIAGDEVASEDELRQWVTTPAGKARIRAALESAHVPGDSAQTLPAPTPAQHEEQQSRYFQLLLDNRQHFPSGGSALDAWRSQHARAIDTALRAGLAHPESSSTAINSAYLSEAFGQHFLTDMFSGGHIRTPRSEIIDWYVSTFAPRVIDSAVLNLRQRLEDGVYRQISHQSVKAWVFEGLARERIRTALQQRIDQGISSLQGGRQRLIEYFGKVVAGLVSGAIHDAEGQRGVVVTSAAHPAPWRALGDSRLQDPSEPLTNMQQAQAAVLAGLRDVNRAYEIGQREGALTEVLPRPDRLPATVYFPFASDAVLPASQRSVDQAAAFLAYNLDTRVDLVGHTDPIGTDGDNLALGQRRADSVASAITGHAVSHGQVGTASMGETALVTRDARRYALDRRVEFVWSSQPAPPTVVSSQDDAAKAYERALVALQAEVGPPYTAVESLIPHALDWANPPVGDWRWDSLAPNIRSEVNAWVAHHFSADLEQQIMSAHMLEPQTVEGYTVDPRPIVRAMLDDIKRDPAGFLDGVFSPFIDPDDYSPD